MKYLTLVFICLSGFTLTAQDTLYIYFLHGSKPKKEFKTTEPKWFGGILGGHVGIGTHTDSILNFLPAGETHLIAKRKDPKSKYIVSNNHQFWSILGRCDTVKKLVLQIPISKTQKQSFQSIKNNYLSQTPYDYAFFGMRCGAASYEILAQLGFLKPKSNFMTATQIFYPRKLRKRLLKSSVSSWEIQEQTGKSTRVWEK